MLEILFGRAGSGKTTRIIHEIEKNVSEKKKTYLIVPEQQVYISERMLASLPPSSALYFEVVSFSRLAHVIFGEYGGLTGTNISTGIKNLVMWQTLREVAPFLHVYKNIKADKNFCSLMLGLIEEFRMNLVTPLQLETAAQNSDIQALSDKLSDISLIYSEYDRIIAEKYGEEVCLSNDILSRLAKILSQYDFFTGKSVFIDSFTSFTGIELDVIKQLIRKADRVVVSVPLCNRGFRSVYTESMNQTVKKLTSFARDEYIEVRDTVMNENLRAENDELKELENCLWNFSVNKDILPDISPEKRGNIILAECKNEYEETEFIALRIIEAHMSGASYSDIAVIPRDAETKKGIFSAVFEKYKIPYFYSERTDLSQSPVCRMINCVLRCILYNYRLTDVLTLVKTGMCVPDPENCDKFEEYCITWDINGGVFTRDVWNMNPDGYTIYTSERGKEILNSANKIRAELIPPIEELKQKLYASDGNVFDMSRALYEYLKRINLSDRLTSLSELELSMNNIREASEIIRTFDFINSALVDLCTVLDGKRVTTDEFATSLGILFAGTDMGSVPAVNDYVTVGSASTLRVENVKTVFVPGLCEGEFPRAFSESALLCEDEKEQLSELGIKLSSREDTIASDELFYVYRTLTLPSSRLFLSTSLCSIDGRKKSPSSVWNRIRFLFPYIHVEKFDFDMIKKVKISEWSGNEDSDIDSLAATDEHKNTENEVDIDPLSVRMLFGDKLSLSKSTINTFTQCPYRFWCEEILNIRERKNGEMLYADSGTFIHFVLERFIKAVKMPSGGLKLLNNEEIKALADSLTEVYIRDVGCIITPSVMYVFSRLRNLALVLISSILCEFYNSDFKVGAVEAKISDSASGILSPIEIRVNENDASPIVSLNGVIDRIDYYSDGKSLFVRIIDYKSGGKKFSINNISDGTDIQLPAYLFTASLNHDSNIFKDFSGEPVYPVGAMYLSCDESNGIIKPSRSGFMLKNDEILHAASNDYNKDILCGITKKDDDFKGDALVNDDEMKELEAILKQTVAQVARKIYSGKAPRRPTKDGCKYCKIRQTCPVALKSKE